MANNLDAFIPEVWSTRIIANLDQANLAMMVCANTDYEGEVRDFGDTVHVRTFGNVAVGPYTRGMTIASQDLSPSKETMVVDQAYYFSFDVDDLDLAQNDINAVEGYTRRAAVAMANHFDQYAFSFYTSAHADNDINNGSAVDITASTAGTTHVYDILVEAGRLLDRKNVDARGRWFFVDPYFKSLLLKDTVYFINGSDLGDALLTTATVGLTGEPMTAREALSRGFVGRAAGFDIYLSNALPAPTASSRALPFGQGRPISFAAQLRPGSPEATRLENSFGVRIKGLTLYGGKVFAEDSKRLGYVVVDQS